MQSTLRFLEMKSKRRYKICIRSVFLGELEAFRKYNGLSVILSKILDAIEPFMKVRTFSYSSLYHIFKSENFRFPFSTKISLTRAVNYKKIILQKIVGSFF